MRQRLTSTDFSIEELFSGRFAFSIPAYQRDYAWGKEEAVQLIDDILAVLEDVERDGAQTPYFLGMMLFVEAQAGDKISSTVGRKKVASEALSRVEVVDGQQRLITICIVFCVLRDILDDEDGAALDGLIARTGKSGEAVPHLQLRAADEAFFVNAIQTRGATRRGPAVDDIGESLARRNMEDVRRAVRLKIQREISVEVRKQLVGFLRRNARVLVVSSDDFDYAYQIFLTINDRGKRLSVEDIFRGEILGPLDREQRERYEAIIDEMEKYREEAESNRTKGKTFFSHLATIDGWPRRGIIEGLKKAVEKNGGPRRFVADVFAPMAESYLQIKRASGARALPVGAEPWLTGLHWLEQHGDDDWVPIAMAGIRRLETDPDGLVDFLRHLDRFAHGLMALGCGREARRRHYTPILEQLLAPAPLPPTSELLNISVGNQRTMLRNIATRLHKSDPPTARLVLLRADQALTRRPMSYYVPLIERDRRDPERYTVEHICPKGELADGDWLRLYPRKPVRVRAAQCIGNLVLITEQQNRRVSQRDFAEKRAVYFPDDVPLPFELSDLVRVEDEWDGPAIGRRYNLVMALVKDLWSLEGPVPVCPALATPVGTSPED